jgi:hypothetical protein
MALRDSLALLRLLPAQAVLLLLLLPCGAAGACRNVVPKQGRCAGARHTAGRRASAGDAPPSGKRCTSWWARGLPAEHISWAGAGVHARWLTAVGRHQVSRRRQPF